MMMADFGLIEWVQFLGSLVALIGVPVVLYRQGVPAADRRFSDTMQKQLENRESMRFLEDRYSKADHMFQGALNATVEVIKVLAPLTAIKSDDLVAKWLDDIRTPGDPVEIVAKQVTIKEDEGIQG